MVRSRIPGMVIRECVRGRRRSRAPDLVADRYRIELLTEPRQQFEVLARIDYRGWIERIVEETALVLRLKTLAAPLPSAANAAARAHQPRYAPGLANDRQIGIVDRLENHHLVAGLDHARIALVSASVRLMSHHLGHRIERQAMPAPVMSRDRLPQLRNAHHRRVLVVAVHTAAAATRRRSSGPDHQENPGRD